MQRRHFLNKLSYQVNVGARTTELESSIHFNPELTSFLSNCSRERHVIQSKWHLEATFQCTHPSIDIMYRYLSCSLIPRYDCTISLGASLLCFENLASTNDEFK